MPSNVNDDESDLDLAGNALPATMSEAAVPMALDELQPWHRERKQIVRNEQWMKLSRQLLNKRNGARQGSQQVKYLTLPGIDYLDVRMLSDICQELSLDLTSIGFLDGEEHHPQIARAKMREASLIQSARITRSSHTFHRRIEDISTGNASAYSDFVDRGPFDIINLDACGSIAKPTDQHSRRIVDALYKILEHQFNFQSHRWLLFITTDVRPDSIAKDTQDQLEEAIHLNAIESEEFRTAAIQLFCNEAKDLDEAIDTAKKTRGISFLKLFSIGLGKWLLHLAKGRQWTLKMHESLCYSTSQEGNNEATMPSLAFEFIPPPRGLHDQFNVTRAQPALGGEVGFDASMRVLEKVENMQDLDNLLAGNVALRKDLANQTHALLKEAGYEEGALAALLDFERAGAA